MSSGLQTAQGFAYWKLLLGQINKVDTSPPQTHFALDVA